MYRARPHDRPSWSFSQVTAVVLLLTTKVTTAFDLDPDSPSSVKSIAKQIAADTMGFYKGNEPGQTPGLLPDPPYYWWEAGALMGTMIDYWFFTGDDQYNDIVMQAMMHQVGENDDYMPENQTLTEGNDDQGFWGLAVMSAAEQKFPNPPKSQPQYLALAQAVFNTQAPRWDNQHCGGGLRWQIFNWNKGYDYKNSISQGTFFALAARLALYTGNTSYADWADKTWDWMVDLKFIDDQYHVYDGAHIPNNCTKLVPYQWTYNAGVFINGAAAMYNLTESETWKTRLDGLVNGTNIFFKGPNNNIMTEVACEGVGLCNTDQQSFKAYLSRWMAGATRWAPHLTDVIMPKLRASSVAAAKQCNGGRNGQMCGLIWTDNGKNDGSTGVGQQMMALEVVLTNVVDQSPAPATDQTGGTSQGDPGAGGADIGQDTPSGEAWKTITAGDTAGAAIATLVLLLAFLAGIVWLFMDEKSEEPLKTRFQSFRTSLSGNFSAMLVFFGLRKGEELDEKGKAIPHSGHEANSATAGVPSFSLLSSRPATESNFLNGPKFLDPRDGRKRVGGVSERELGEGGGSGLSSQATSTIQEEPSDTDASLQKPERPHLGMFRFS